MKNLMIKYLFEMFFAKTFPTNGSKDNVSTAIMSASSPQGAILRASCEARTELPFFENSKMSDPAREVRLRVKKSGRYLE